MTSSQVTIKGPTKDGINTLIGGPPPEDTYVSIGHYRHFDGNIYDTSRALVSALCILKMAMPTILDVETGRRACVRQS